jgi:predicted nucleic acid-binding protein
VIVLDASAAIDLLLDVPPHGERVSHRLAEEGEAHAPHLVDAEVGQVLRRYVLTGQIREDRARLAIDHLAELPLVRYPHSPLLAAAFGLVRNLPVYDALYVVLAAGLGATLLTADGRLARAARRLANIELLGP